MAHGLILTQSREQRFILILTPTNPGWDGPSASLASAAIWAFVVILWKPLIRRFGADATNFCKNAIAAVAFVVGLYVFRGDLGLDQLPELTSYQIWTLIASSILGMSIGDGLLFYAAAKLGAQRALLILNFIPLLTLILAWLISGEEIHLSQVVGISLVVLGIGIVLFDGPRLRSGSLDKGGIVAALLCVVVNSFSILWRKPSLTVVDSATVSMLQLIVGAFGVLVLASLFGRSKRLVAPLQAADSRVRVLILSLVGTGLAYYLFIYGIQNNSSAVAATLSGMTPIFAIPFLWIIEKKRPELRTWFGTTLSTGGVVLILVAPAWAL
jgi:drug/metabolite transporter (DMT)-like permease